MSEQSVNETKSSNIGDLLRAKREEKGMSVASAAMHTNLRKDIIEKLENNQFSDIGAPVFTRGYLNIYGRFLELDDSEVCEALSSSNASQSNQTLRIHSANAESQSKPYRRSFTKGWLSFILVLIIGGVLILQLLNNDSWLMHQIKGAFGRDAQGTSIVTEQQLDTHSNAPHEFKIEVDNEVKKVDTPTLTSIEETPFDSVDMPLTGVQTNELTLSSLEGIEGNTDEPSQARPIADQVEPLSVGSASLKTNIENWIEITDSTGKVVTSQIYSPGSVIDLTGDNSPFVLNIGRPKAITLTINGNEQPLDNFRTESNPRLFNLSIPNE